MVGYIVGSLRRRTPQFFFSALLSAALPSGLMLQAEEGGYVFSFFFFLNFKLLNFEQKKISPIEKEVSLRKLKLLPRFAV